MKYQTFVKTERHINIHPPFINYVLRLLKMKPFSVPLYPN